MNRSLLDFYEAELNYIRAAAAEFAVAHPETAANLGISQGERRDPHVERLIEAFAFLTARIQLKLNDELPELTDALLESLYPHYLAPIPSLLNVQFSLDATQSELAGGVEVEKGAIVESEPIDGIRLKFTTGYPVRALPLTIESAHVRPLTKVRSLSGQNVLSELRLTLRCLNADLPIEQLALSPLQFCLGHDERMGIRLYELILADTLGLAVAADANDAAPRSLPLSSLEPLGLEPDDAVLPMPAGSHPAYRLLSEFAAYPSRFLYFQIKEIPPETLRGCRGRFDLVFYLRRPAEMLERQVNASHFLLGCTPAVNLFDARAEPISLKNDMHKVRMAPHLRPPRGYEVYCIDEMQTRSPTTTKTLVPVYENWRAVDGASGYYQISRKAPHRIDDELAREDVYVSLVDITGAPAPDPGTTLHAELKCFNGEHPTRPGAIGAMQLAEGGAVSVRPIGSPTRVLRRDHRSASRWQLISHLTLNQIAIAGSESTDVVRRLLRLYGNEEVQHIRSAVESLVSVKHERAVARVSDGPAALCRGENIELILDRSRIADGGGFVFASVLERFFALLCTVNSFTRLSLRYQDDNQVVKQWPPRGGEVALI